jgi:DNA-binding CsgD family transcriptional regulator
MAYANMASLAMNDEDADGVNAWGGRAIELARAIGAEDIEIHALNSIGTVEFLRDGPDARATGERSVELAVATDDVESALRTYANVAWAAIRHRELALADRYLEPAIELASDPERDLWWLHLNSYRARVALDRGRWSEAGEIAAQIIRNRRVSPLPPLLALSVTGRLRARRGDPDPWGPLDEALALSVPELQRVEPVAVARVEAAWLAGDPERVVAEAERVEPIAQRCDARWVLGELACWRRRAGAHVDPDIETTGPYALELAGAFEEAADAWTALGFPYEAAIARAGSADAALQRQALEDLQALGALGAAAVVARELRRRGAANLPRGPRPTTRDNPAQLTARELEVLLLVAEGLRNRDIADRLFLSTKTVAHHVASIMSKLGARSRGEAAVEAERLGLVER